MRILLWDIDGTLVKTSGAGSRALGRAVKALPAAATALQAMRLDGMTDYKIARVLCAAQRHHEAPHQPLEHHARDVTTQEMDTLLEQYLTLLQHVLQTPDGYEVLPGVHEALDALKDRAVHALGTGNLERGAHLKLTPGNLWQRFAFGGFGSDAEERADILKAAWRKAETHLQRPCTAAEFVVVGDTPKDVAAAHLVGMACVGVATGRFSVDELRESGADDAVQNLKETDALERILHVQKRA